MKKITIFVLFFSLAFVSVSHAITVNVPGRSIEINESTGGAGSVNIKGVDGATVLDVNKSTNGTSTVTTPGRTIDVAPQSVKINANGATLNVNKAQDVLSVEINGEKIKIKSDNDLESYKQMVLENCASLQGINTEGNTVEVKYNQPARFFGIFKTGLDAKVSVDESGKVEVKLPWYRFLFTKNTGELKSQIQAKVDGSGDVSLSVGRKALLVNLVNDGLSLNVAPCKVSVKSDTKNSNGTTNNQAGTTSSASTNTSAVSLVSFKGEWKGSYTVSSFADKGCAKNGEVSLSVDDKGGVVGYAIIEAIKTPGAGTVDVNGNIKGTWTLSQGAISFAGKLNTNTNKGSGAYQNKLGCYGTFSLNR